MPLVHREQATQPWSWPMPPFDDLDSDGTHGEQKENILPDR